MHKSKVVVWERRETWERGEEEKNGIIFWKKANMGIKYQAEMDKPIFIAFQMGWKTAFSVFKISWNDS
jgi:hypothetical protein